MKRHNFSDSELDQLQRLKQENQRLKRDLSRLKKQVSRMDLSRFDHIKELLEESDRAEQEAAVQEKQAKLWECFECRKGVLRLVILERLGGAIYNRVCDNCGNKTKFQKYTDKVTK
jgi:hypothetical protein